MNLGRARASVAPKAEAGGTARPDQKSHMVVRTS